MRELASHRVRIAVRRLACARGISMADLAGRVYGERSGAPYLRLLRRLQGRARWTLDDVELVARELGVEPGALAFGEVQRGA